MIGLLPWILTALTVRISATYTDRIATSTSGRLRLLCSDVVVWLRLADITRVLMSASLSSSLAVSLLSMLTVSTTSAFLLLTLTFAAIVNTKFAVVPRLADAPRVLVSASASLSSAIAVQLLMVPFPLSLPLAFPLAAVMDAQFPVVPGFPRIALMSVANAVRQFVVAFTLLLLTLTRAVAFTAIVHT
jgi:hypothetical protein